MANLKCTPSDRQMYPQGYMYPRLGTLAIEHHFNFAFDAEPLNTAAVRTTWSKYNITSGWSTEHDESSYLHSFAISATQYILSSESSCYPEMSKRLNDSTSD